MNQAQPMRYLVILFDPGSWYFWIVWGGVDGASFLMGVN
jgi:hypothetical protein